MDYSRRDFLKNAAILSGAAGLSNVLPTSIRRAMAISADTGTTFYDAEHIVLLMQENRSFDHMFGTLKGVRGFNDPRAKWLPDQDKVWIQKNKKGKAHAPFHLDINKTKITWQGGLPHGWPDQSSARNRGKYDNWIPQKTSMTMGYYDRSDLPFYYALADAFTICDHNFCASLTGTTPNRLFFWTGNIRAHLDSTVDPAVYNSMAESRTNTFVDWYTFPELLEDNNISWRIYQNALWTSNLNPPDIDYWLGNYGDNAIEYVKRHHVELSAYFRQNGDSNVTPHLSPEMVIAKYNKLSRKEKDLVDKAFTTNIDASDNYLKLEPYTFTNDEGKQQTVNIPKHDIFKQFRSDVKNGTLPTISWLVAPQSFSDHTSSPLYGTWYVSEALDILTQDPEVWKKTIFIWNYDENDGYFDHLPPFVVPKPGDSLTGKVSAGINVSPDYDHKDDLPIGLGYRVPMIVASPWSRGGYVNSQVFDHTSTLMFLENFLKKKTGKDIHCPLISDWRRAVCGDLSSVFRPYNGEEIPLPDFEKREAVITNIQDAKNRPAQLVPKPLSRKKIKKINKYPSFSPDLSSLMPKQEKGTKPACALPYQFYVECTLDENGYDVILNFKAAIPDFIYDMKPAGAAFNVYTPSAYAGDKGKTWAYAVEAGKMITDKLTVDKFPDEHYDICVHGPNGFFRQFTGSKGDPALKINCVYEQSGLFKCRLSGNILLELENNGEKACQITKTDNAYNSPAETLIIPPHSRGDILINLNNSSGWYDFTIISDSNNAFGRRYAGHVETGNESITDPYMGGLLEAVPNS
jgi:phospholipase C